MQQPKNANNIMVSSHKHLPVKAAAVLVVSIVLGSMLVQLAEAHSAAYSANNWNIQVRAGLMQSACRLEMTSAYQDVRLGETGTARLRQIGAQGTPVIFQLRLRDCLRTSASRDDERSDNRSWRSYQPAVSASFVALADADNPQLVKISGASGVALRITDSSGRNIRLGNHAVPLMLAAGHDILSYTVSPERTQAPLNVGAYSAQLNFRLNYD